MKLRRALAIGAFMLLACLVTGALVAGGVWWYFHPAYTRHDGVVYAQRQGRDLTFDVVRPARANGCGIVLIVSGGWRSGPGGFRPWMVAPLLRRGYTILAVSHLSQPEATVMEIIEDMHRAIRFIRDHAAAYAIDPDRLGVTGGSAGGHLGLIIATCGGPGLPEAEDPVERQSSAVRAVAVFYPVTDLLNLGDSTENPGDGGPPKSFVKAFGPGATNPATWRVIGRNASPIYHVHSNLPPILIIHGDADTLVPLDQSERFQAEARELGQAVELLVRPGKGHGWLTMVWDIRLIGDWFDRHLRED